MLWLKGQVRVAIATYKSEHLNRCSDFVLPEIMLEYFLWSREGLPLVWQRVFDIRV